MMKYMWVMFPLLSSLSVTACGASFDCTKAGTATEKMICADSKLSRLDDQLARMYRAALSSASTATAKEIQAQQKEWLRSSRDICASTSCLAQAYEEQIRKLASHGQSAHENGAVCPISEKSLAGDWKSVSGGAFEAMSFEISGTERTFNSWLHQRPEIIGGNWKMENCTIYIRHPTEEKLSYAFKVVRTAEGRIYLQEKSGKSESVYQRMNQ